MVSKLIVIVTSKLLKPRLSLGLHWSQWQKVSNLTKFWHKVSNLTKFSKTSCTIVSVTLVNYWNTFQRHDFRFSIKLDCHWQNVTDLKVFVLTCCWLKAVIVSYINVIFVHDKSLLSRVPKKKLTTRLSVQLGATCGGDYVVALFVPFWLY